MKTLRVVIELELKGDEDDQETLKDSVYQYIQELIEADELEYTVVADDEDEDDDS
jgi:hypothetical protein